MTRAATASPCVGVCRIAGDPPVCAGCGRTLAEIGAWRGADDAERRRILAVCRERLAAARAAPDQADPAS